MWHEARKQEKIVRKVIVDYRRRAERRHDYYDKIKQDPTKFMQVHGKRMKLHIDESGTLSDTDLHMVPWQGDKSNMIDRFDVRAHLDFITEVKPTSTSAPANKEEKKMNFERYRILVYNKHKGITEDQHLQKILINEKYPEIGIQKQEAETKKQLLQSSKAMIGFDYSGGAGDSSGIKEEEQEEDDSDISSEDEEFLSELEDIPPLRELNSAALQDLERFSLDFGMGYTDFVQAMDNDQNIQERVDQAKAIESEKLKMAGKKSRRERRVLRDKRLKDRVIGPLSYIRRDDAEKDSGSGSESSCSEEEHDKSKEGEIEFITSFGETNDSSSTAPPGTTKLPSVTAKKETKKSSRRTRSRSRSRRSRSRDRSRRSRSRSRGYYRSRRESSSRRRDYRGRSSSRDRYSRRSRSRSRGRRSRSRDRRYDRRSRSRDRRSRSRGRKSRDKSPAKVATATLKSATPAKTSLTADAIKKLTPQEKLKIKMQRALKKQLKADQITMANKRAQMFTEQMEREDELREMARKLRRKDDEKMERGSPYRRR